MYTTYSFTNSTKKISKKLERIFFFKHTNKASVLLLIAKMKRAMSFGWAGLEMASIVQQARCIKNMAYLEK